MKTRWPIVIGASSIVLALLLGVLGPWLIPTAFSGSTYGGMMGGLGWLDLLTMALFWIGVIALVVWGLGSLFSARQPINEPDALEILRRRYARGEISHEEFVQARSTLL
jgi:putative membrane protein